MKHYWSIGIFILCFLLVPLATATAGAFKETGDKHSGINGVEGVQVFLFSEEGTSIDFILTKSAGSINLEVAKNMQTVLYSQKINNVKCCRIRQVYNSEAKRYFYLVALTSGIGDIYDEFFQVMGTEPQTGGWKIYADKDSFPNHFWFYVDKNGDLLLNSSNLDKNNQSFNGYIFFWNEKNQRLEYKKPIEKPTNIRYEDSSPQSVSNYSFLESKAVLKEFHDNITRKKYSVAYDCMSSNLKKRIPYNDWQEEVRTTVLSSVYNIEVASSSADRVVLTYCLQTEGTPGGIQVFTGTAVLIKTNYGWKLDEITNKKKDLY